MDVEPGDFIERPRGLLTKKERKHLVGELKEDPQEDADAIRQREYRISQHLRHALIDFYLLVSQPELGDDLESLRDSYNQAPDSWASEDPLLAGGLGSLFELLFYYLGSKVPETGSPFGDFCAPAVERSLVRMYAEDGVSVDPDVHLVFDPGERVPTERVKQDYEDGKLLFENEIAHLGIVGEIDHGETLDALDDLRQAVEAMSIKEREAWRTERREQRAAAAIEDPE